MGAIEMGRRVHALRPAMVLEVRGRLVPVSAYDEGPRAVRERFRKAMHALAVGKAVRLAILQVHRANQQTARHPRGHVDQDPKVRDEDVSLHRGYAANMGDDHMAADEEADASGGEP